MLQSTTRRLLTTVGQHCGPRRLFPGAHGVAATKFHAFSSMARGAGAPLKHITKISDLSRAEFLELVLFGHEFKLAHLDGRKHDDFLENKILLMFFNKPSLRTRLSLEIAMKELGGSAIYYPLDGQPMGKKESIHDTAKVVSRYVDGITARITSRHEIAELAQHASVPVINALDDNAHPCQILADYVTMLEFLHRPFNQITMTYIGDVANNVTYDLMRAAAMIGMKMRICGPEGERWQPEQRVMDEVKQLLDANQDVQGRVDIIHDPVEAVTGADVVYTDTWMSYHISGDEQAERMKVFQPYTVTSTLMSHTNADSIFMHCLPRGIEAPDEVSTGKHSVIFDQAENRLHAQKALLTWLMDGRIKM